MAKQIITLSVTTMLSDMCSSRTNCNVHYNKAEIFRKIKHVYGKPFVGSSGEDGIMQRRGGYFYDLGCGTGKPLVAAALLHEFDVCCGIECLEGLFTAAVELVGIYNAKVICFELTCDNIILSSITA